MSSTTATSNVPVATGAAPIENGSVPALEGKALDEAIVFQVEYYLSRDNLSRDTYLQSQMDEDQYVSLSVLAQFNKLKRLSSDIVVIASALQGSRLVELDAEGKKVKPKPRPQRNTIILREIPSETPSEAVEALFKVDGAPEVKEVRSDVGDNWFVVLEDESAALGALNWLRSQTFNGEPVRARMKTESTLLRSYFVPSAGAPRPQVVPFVPSGVAYYGAPAYGVPVAQQPWEFQQQQQIGANGAAPRYGGQSLAAGQSQQSSSQQQGGGQRNQGQYQQGRRGGERNYAGGGGRGNRKSSPTRSGGNKRAAQKPQGKGLPKPEPELTLAQFPPLASDQKSEKTLDSEAAPIVAPVGHYVAPKPGGGYGGRNFVKHNPEVLARVARDSAAGKEGPPDLLANLKTATSGPMTEREEPLQEMRLAGHDQPHAWGPMAKEAVSSPPRKAHPPRKTPAKQPVPAKEKAKEAKKESPPKPVQPAQPSPEQPPKAEPAPAKPGPKSWAQIAKKGPAPKKR